MWNNLSERILDLGNVICLILSFLIPLIIYKINHLFRKNTDPPWKKE